MRLAPSTANSAKLFRRGYALHADNAIIPREVWQGRKAVRKPLTVDDIKQTYFDGVPRHTGHLSRTKRTGGFTWQPTTALLSKIKVVFAKNKQTAGKILIMVQRFPAERTKQQRLKPEVLLQQVEAMILRVEEGTLLIQAIQFSCLELVATQGLVDVIWRSPFVYDQASLAILVLAESGFGEKKTWVTSKNEVHLDNDTVWHERRVRFHKRLGTVRYYTKPPNGVFDPLTNDRLAALDRVFYFITAANCLYFDICVGRGFQKLKVLMEELRLIKVTIANSRKPESEPESEPDSELDTESLAIE